MSAGRNPSERTPRPPRLCRPRAARCGDAVRGAGPAPDPIRRRVLELIWQGHKAARRLRNSRTAGGRRAQAVAADGLPCTGFRRAPAGPPGEFAQCLCRLCPPGDPHAAQIFICDRCGVAVEQSDGTLQRRILRNAQGMHFLVREQTVEITGICPRCAEHQHEA